MADVRIISWNIFNFAAGKSGIMSNTLRSGRVLDTVHPPAGKADFDIFVIIEPVTKKGKVGSAAVGGGPTGGTQLLALLRSRPTDGADWAQVDPLCIYSKTKGETVLVFYRTPVVKEKTKPDVLSNLAPPKGKNWLIKGGRESCPFHVTFDVVGTTTSFDLIAQHAPSPSYGADKNGKANAGVDAVRTHATVTGGTHVVYLGDLNLCSVLTPAVAPACDLTGHDDDRTTLGKLVTDGMLLVSDRDRSSLKKGAASYDVYREHAYDNILSKGHVTASGAGVIDLVKPLVLAYQSTKPGAIPANVFTSKKMFYQIRIGSKCGISDHLPVKITLSY